ncbi:MAG: FAD-dependent oxidoreductase, partial [Desulfobacteraceae bacterium]|nr:FAD-dependent oxidoreductase [Desulfobacteraceae bacterium]
ELTIPSMYRKQGCFVHLAKAIKEVVSIPVAAVGRIKDPKLAEKILAEDNADFISMGRPLLADPFLPQKAKQGKFSEIRPCLGCCLGCIHAVLAREPGSCVVNPDVGREFRINKKDNGVSDKIFNILIVGAGPSGLACARHFAMKGHGVTICEKNSHYGGLLSLAAKTPGRSELNDILEFFLNELKRLNVKIDFNTELSKELLEKINPDKVVLATGSMPDMPMVKGLFQSDMEILTCVDILEDNKANEDNPDIKDNIIVLGGGMSALLTADYLSEKGKNVVVLNRKSSYAEEMSSNDRYYLRERLKENSVKLFKNVSITKFSNNGVAFKANSEEQSLDNFDTVVIAEKMSPIREVSKYLKGSNIEFHFIGDAKIPRHLMYCISEAQEMIR